MELMDAASHAVSAAGGGLTMGYIAKVLIQNWIKAHDTRADKAGEALQLVAVELAKIGVKMEGLQRSADSTVKYGEAIAILQTKVEDLTKCLNGLGQKVRALPSGR